MKTEMLVVVSDIHCGSDVGLAPPETETEKGNVIGFGKNHHQSWLWDRWLEAAAQVKAIIGKTPKAQVALAVNGDATEGSHHHNSSDLVSADILVHTKMAEVCLSHLAQLCGKTFVTAGTECHTLNMENELAKLLKAVSRKARDKWILSIRGCLVDIAHHMTTTSRAYLEASAMSILMGNARLNYLRAGHPVPRVYLRAHRHCGGHYSDNDGLFAVTGAWQFLTRHGHKVVTDSIPRPSVIVLDWRGKPEGSLPAVHSITFNAPKHESVTT